MCAGDASGAAVWSGHAQVFLLQLRVHQRARLQDLHGVPDVLRADAAFRGKVWIVYCVFVDVILMLTNVMGRCLVFCFLGWVSGLTRSYTCCVEDDNSNRMPAYTLLAVSPPQNPKTIK